MTLVTSLVVLAGLAVGVIAGYFVRKWVAINQKESIEKKAEETLGTARSQAKELELEAKNKAAILLQGAQDEEKAQKKELRDFEERIRTKEDAVDKRVGALDEEKKGIEQERARIKTLEEETETLKNKATEELEGVAGTTREDALEKIKEAAEKDHREELGIMLARFERDKKEAIERKGVGIITTALQRYARGSIADITTSVVHIPDEDLKGKIIGREGRNIKAFERLTGVEVVVDETPESILLSSFDPLRREVARIALEKLIKDGRIQPAKVEEKVEEARAELDEEIKKAGEEAAYEVGIVDLPKEITHLLGRLKYRTSYGQNVLFHSIEMAHIAGMIAAELGLNVEVAKKGALVHDIGKAIDHEVEGTHIDIGRKLLKKYGVDERVIQAMEAHHEEYPHAIPEAFVVTTADVISGARPGARRDTLEKYLKRLEEIEKVVNGFEGVKNAYAIAAGREVRVFATPEKIDDFGAMQLAKNIANKIQSDIQYPGEIKVTVVREVKAVEYAR
jgi:ribonucrease Y